MADPSATSGSPSSQDAPPTTGRRNILTATVAVLVGGVLALFPFAAGAMVFLDPILRKKEGEESSDDAKPGKWLRIASVAAVPVSGEPVQFPVIDDLVDAWNRQPDQPVGAVYLRRLPEEQGSSEVKIQAFNAICPHAGCFVGFSADNEAYKCPCHNSSFNIDGSIRENKDGSINPAPRPLDKLEVDQDLIASKGEVWVRFVNYLTGHSDQVAK